MEFLSSTQRCKPHLSLPLDICSLLRAKVERFEESDDMSQKNGDATVGTKLSLYCYAEDKLGFKEGDVGGFTVDRIDHACYKCGRRYGILRGDTQDRK